MGESLNIKICFHKNISLRTCLSFFWEDSKIQIFVRVSIPFYCHLSEKKNKLKFNQFPNREKPLACYVFSKKRTITREFTKNVSAGGICVNDVINQYQGDFFIDL